MQGKVMGNSLVILDAFALPVQGTETRVNAQDEANEYMVQYLDLSSKVSIISTTIRPIQNLLYIGWTSGECRWMVPLSSRIRMLVVGY